MTEQIEISKFEINPNGLRQYSKVPLPDFAVSALLKNGFSYSSGPNSGVSEHDLLVKNGQLKLKEHIQHVKQHLDRDGPRVWNDSAHTNVRDPLYSQPTGGGSAAN
jgi:hypothetical protein